MSEYIIHNIDLVVTPQLDLDELEEQEKPSAKFPHHYISKLIGGKGNEYRNRSKGLYRSSSVELSFCVCCG